MVFGHQVNLQIAKYCDVVENCIKHKGEDFMTDKKDL